jgi:hypothetical protein
MSEVPMCLGQYTDQKGIEVASTSALKEMIQKDLEAGNITSQDYHRINDELDWLID